MSLVPEKVALRMSHQEDFFPFFDFCPIATEMIFQAVCCHQPYCIHTGSPKIHYICKPVRHNFYAAQDTPETAVIGLQVLLNGLQQVEKAAVCVIIS